MEKKKYEFIKDVKERIANGQPTEFWERNIVNIEEKKLRKKKNLSAKKGVEIHKRIIKTLQS